MSVKKNAQKPLSSIAQDARDLKKEAAKLQGVAALMNVYNGMQKVQSEYLKYAKTVAPLVTSQASSSSVPDGTMCEVLCPTGQES
jgi:hypothetical protein